MKILKSLVIVIVLFSLVNSVFAVEPNNKYGIHLAQPHLNDLKSTAELINSKGGDWGYVTLVIQENDRDRAKWQDIFDRLRGLRLIPIVRIATKPEGENWRRPKKEDVREWIEFLDSLNWVVKNRYVVLFNEPNHGSEWGGSVDAQSYVEVTGEFAKKLKEKNADFFVMLAGFDASAPHAPPLLEDEETFVEEIFNLKFEIFNYIDGWASHSYPNPGFSGSPWAYGRGTVRGYEWELAVLRELGVARELPVFITETGWKRDVKGYLNEEIVATYFKTTYENVWGPDERVMAVTPFVLDYQSDPFLGFSWKLPSAKTSEERTFYEQYYTVQTLPKTKGDPEIVERGSIQWDFSKELVAHSSYDFKVMLYNEGQAIWDSKDSYQLSVISNQSAPFEYLFSDVKNVKPFQEGTIDFFLKTTSAVGNNTLKVVLKKKDAAILETKEIMFEIVPLPSLKFQITLFPKLKTEGNDFEVQVFDEKESLVFKRSGVSVKEKNGEASDIQNIILGKKYRVVILKPYYLPRQEFIVFKKNNNMMKFKQMIPFDFNRNGRGDWLDLTTLLKNISLLKLLLP